MLDLYFACQNADLWWVTTLTMLTWSCMIDDRESSRDKNTTNFLFPFLDRESVHAIIEIRQPPTQAYFRGNFNIDMWFVIDRLVMPSWLPYYDSESIYRLNPYNYYHVLWVAKYQRVSKHKILRDRCRKLADPCLDRWPIYFPIIVHKRDWEISLCLPCDLVDNPGGDVKNCPGFKHFST